MIQVRNGTFETNSSSTHSICISKNPVDYFNCNFIDFHLGEYGWRFEEVDTASYLYTAIMCIGDEEERERNMNRLIDVLDCYNVSYTFESPQWDDEWDNYLLNGGIDHAYDAREFVDAVLSNEDLLMRCLFGDSVVYTGNDNADWEDWDMWWVGYKDHPKHDEDKYDYFVK